MRLRSSLLFAAALLAGCSSSRGNDAASEAPVTSNEAGFVDFDFDGQLVATGLSTDDDVHKAIVAQIFYVVGPLTSFGGQGRVGQLVASNVQSAPAGDLTRVSYHVKLPVAWPKDRPIPHTYDLVLPTRADAQGLGAFNAAYDGTCGKDEYGQDVFWHDFTPDVAGCSITPGDVVRTTATVTTATNVTHDKYPEYDRIWSDGKLAAFAIFGAAGDPTDASDEGVQQYGQFLDGVSASLPGSKRTENAKSDSITRDVTITAKTPSGDVSVTAILIGTLYTSGPDVAARVQALTADADYVVYNGHSELSKNTNALAHMATVTKGQYQLFFFDSCDTFAYLDTSLLDARKAANGSADPNGTKYLDVATNLLPSYFVNYSSSSLTFLRALLAPDVPRSYNQLLADLPSDQVVVVSGEEDNTFAP